MDQPARNKLGKDVEWVLPAAIPFAELKSRDLEECVFWLFDALGAKDLEWRTGGTGGGAADGGRDLEAHFYTPSIDDEVEPQNWWIECKGRTGTLEKAEVQESCNNALARENLDYLVIATNTQFSNPTRDWIAEWQKKHRKPKVKLWDKDQLERLLSRHPAVVLRLFSDALSMQGRVQAMEARFWNRLEYSPPGLLAQIWKEREALEFSHLSVIASIASEFSNGSTSERPWAAILEPDLLVETLHLALANVPYLVLKCIKSGADQTPVIRAVSYLLMCAVQHMEPDKAGKLVLASLNRADDVEMPEDVKTALLMPIVDQMLSELQDLCSHDCERMLLATSARLTDSGADIETYWRQFEIGEGNCEKKENDRRLLIEKTDAPCKVRFPVGPERGCPLFGTAPTIANLTEVLGIVKQVVQFRRAEAARKA